MLSTISWYLQLPFRWWKHATLRKYYAREARRCAQELVIAEALGEKGTATSLRYNIQRLRELDKQEIRSIAKFHGIEGE